MTIVVAVASPDGIVLASDSRTTMLAGGHHRVASDYTRKVFALPSGIGVATHGRAFIGHDTIDGLMARFVAKNGAAGSDVDAVAKSLATFFTKHFNEYLESSGQTLPAGTRPVGFLVAGYDREGVGRIRQLRIPSPAGKRVEQLDVSTRDRGALWRGETSYARRLIEGVDWDELKKVGVKMSAKVKDDVEKQTLVLNRPITLQDALDFALFVVRTTIDMERFTDGTSGAPRRIPVCGGGIQALAITPSSVEWIMRPALAPSAGGVAERG